MQARSNFAGRVKPWHCRRGGFRIDPDASHHIVACGSYFHGPLGDIHIGQFEELVIHAGELLLYVFRGLMGDIQEGTAVLGAASFAYFGIYGPRDNVTRGELHALGIVFLHEALARFVAKDAALAADGFGDQNTLHAGRPHHARRMELNELKSLSSAPASKASAIPSAVYSQEFEVTLYILPMPPVASTTDFARNTTKRPCSRQ